MPVYGGGFIGLVSLLLTIWGVVAIVKSGADDVAKLVWVLIVLLLPIIGFVIWYLMGPGSKAFPLGTR